ncbi:hypothetical protein [Treponema zioleckii]|uniref:hypothetical protein n=1 Tax=Treponema zioleckii TaxID=331680 RepID=UPI00168AE7FA|nr:hypothetical protein [Treponema zioleckii]
MFSMIVLIETKHLKLAENKPKDIKKFDRQAWAVNGEYFFVKYSFDKKQRTIYLDNSTLFIGASYTLPVGLPLNLKVVVPENEKFLYLGDFSYSAKGFGFDLSCAVSDEFEAAQFALNEVTKEEYSLCRANPQIFSEEESKHVRNRNWFVFYDEKDWYKTLKMFL